MGLSTSPLPPPPTLCTPSLPTLTGFDVLASNRRVSTAAAPSTCRTSPTAHDHSTRSLGYPADQGPTGSRMLVQVPSVHVQTQPDG
jgi:hypothetical protein